MKRPDLNQVKDALRAHPRLLRVAPIVLALALGLNWWSHHHGEEKIAEKSAPADRVHLDANAPQRAFLQLDDAIEAPLPAAGPFNGRLALAEDLTARIYPPVAGRVLRLSASVGDTVREGAPLADLDAPDFGAAIADARKADADAVRRHSALNRARTLFEGEAISRRELEDAEADAAAAQAESARAQQRLANLAPRGGDFASERLALRSPLSGVVVDRQANPGTEVRPDSGVPLFVVSNLTRLWLTLDLAERDTAVRVGDLVYFTVDAWPGETFTARIDRVSPVVDPTTRRLSARAVVDNKAGRLRPEMYARAVAAAENAPKVIRLPATALLTQGLQAAIFVDEGNGDLVRRPVKVQRQDKEFVYLSEESSVKPGDKVVTRGALLLASELAGAE